MSVAPPSGQNRVMIYGPKNDGTYIVEFRTAEALAISVPASETRVLKHFQKRMPYGLFVPDVAWLRLPRTSLRCLLAQTNHHGRETVESARPSS
jgi:hypothetical protein